jgi:hypothetical protein
MAHSENPFVFGDIIDDASFVNRADELTQLVRDLADGQKVFLLSPRQEFSSCFGPPQAEEETHSYRQFNGEQLLSWSLANSVPPRNSDSVGGSEVFQ